MIEEKLSAIRTVTQSLRDAAAAGTGITFVSAAGQDEVRSYARVQDDGRRIAAGLAALGVQRGDRVALIVPDERDFVRSVFGVWLSGAAAVPLAPPLDLRQASVYAKSTRELLAASGSRLVICPRAIGALLPDIRHKTPSELARSAADEVAVDVALDDLALVQFTSGSTARPKGVALTHGNLGANCAVVNFEGLETGPGDRTASWLPLFHDMGLIGFILCPMYNALPATLMPPLAFLARPANWLQMLSRLRGTITFAPNFAFAYATKRVRDDQLKGVDLSCVRVMGCGAEPIQKRTLEEFAQRFARYGFREEAFYPSYGLAESSLAVSFGRGLVCDRVDAAALADERRARPARDATSAQASLIGCGPAFSGHRIEIVDPRTGSTVPDRHVGEIRLRGPSVMSGYLDDETSTRDAFDAEGRLKTGDLGYLAEGQLFVCGRIKDTIIVRGRNYHPHDIEWAAGQVDGVRPGCVAAFGVPSNGEEQVCIVAEARSGSEPRALEQAIRDAVGQRVGLVAEHVAIVPPRTVRKTSSGKVRRQEMRRLFVQDALSPQTGSWLSLVGPALRVPWTYVKSALGR